MPTESCPELAKLFADFNRRYFRGQLPSVELFWVDPDPEEIAWCVTPSVDLDQKRKLKVGHIEVSRELKEWGKFTKYTVLHEMVHWKLRNHPIVGQHGRGDIHGHAFQREMKRLANIGAFRTLW